jgi:hypothetical protein
MKPILLLLCAVLLVSCTESASDDSANAKYIMKNDFESLAGWLPANNSLTTEQAHSGKYSIKVDKSQEYSMGFGDLLSKVTSRKPHRVNLSGWAYLPSNKATAHYQLQILDPSTGQSIFQDGIILSDQIQAYKTWMKVEKEIDLPENIVSAYEIRVYLWRASAEEPTYIDDVALKIIE